MSGNLGIGVIAFGASAAKVLGMGAGTAPTTFPANMFQMWAEDIAAGNCAPHFATESGKVIKLYQQGNIASAKVDYGTGDLDTEAEIIAAINAANGKLNSVLTIIQNLGLMAAPA